MLKLNAQDLVNQFQSKLDQAAPKDNLFLSTFTLAGENEWAKADIQNIFIRPDFTLNITQLKVKKAVELASPFPDHLVGFTFNLNGFSKFIIPVNNTQTQFVKGTATAFKTNPHTGYARFMPQNNYVSMAIHLSLAKFNEIIGDYFDELPQPFANAILGQTEHWLTAYNYNAQTKLLLESLLTEDLKGLSRQFFIESKVLELIGIQLDQIIQNHKTTSLNPSDIAKLEQCEQILRDNYNQPLSLMQLAKQIGLNDFKLKQGFKALYGKPVFKYLQEYRLNKAFEQLKIGNKQVKQVADDIGYNSIGSFSNAFYAQFGVRPSDI